MRFSTCPTRSSTSRGCRPQRSSALSPSRRSWRSRPWRAATTTAEFLRASSRSARARRRRYSWARTQWTTCTRGSWSMWRRSGARSIRAIPPPQSSWRCSIGSRRSASRTSSRRRRSVSPTSWRPRLGGSPPCTCCAVALASSPECERERVRGCWLMLKC
eukprot:Amastigsp_a339347_883.p3 type:complete len:160 gc:universal Amastigsp_a339347_883:493-14(-)